MDKSHAQRVRREVAVIGKVRASGWCLVVHYHSLGLKKKFPSVATFLNANRLHDWGVACLSGAEPTPRSYPQHETTPGKNLLVFLADVRNKQQE
jgi:hypothetical protein